jgi:hypothetical protein
MKSLGKEPKNEWMRRSNPFILWCALGDDFRTWMKPRWPVSGYALKIAITSPSPGLFRPHVHQEPRLARLFKSFTPPPVPRHFLRSLFFRQGAEPLPLFNREIDHFWVRVCHKIVQECCVLVDD